MVNFRARAELPDLRSHYRDIIEPIGKVFFATFSEEEIRAIERELRAHPLADKFEFIRSERSLFEILPKGVDKGLSITKLAEYLKIDIKKTIAVGDYNNDVPMLKAAGLGVAVSNACREALDAADLVTVSNEEDAIARIIYDLRDGKITL
jgi:HAD superfamily hydrolase (TIGR01484 family)